MFTESSAITLMNIPTWDPFLDSLLPAILQHELDRRISPRHTGRLDVLLLGNGKLLWGPAFSDSGPDESFIELCAIADGLFTPQTLSAEWTRLIGQPRSPEAPTICCQVSQEMLDCGPVWDLIARHYCRALLLSGPDGLSPDAIPRRRDLDICLFQQPLSAVDLVALLWGADGFIGSGVAGCLTALGFHKPHVALGTSPELVRYLQEVGQPVVCLADPGHLEAIEALLSPERTLALTAIHDRLTRKITRVLDTFTERLLACPKAQHTSTSHLPLSHTVLAEQDDCIRRLRAEVLQLRAALFDVRQEYRVFRGRFCIRLVERLSRLVGTVPLLRPALTLAAQAAQSTLHSWRRSRDLLRHFARHTRNVARHYARVSRDFLVRLRPRATPPPAAPAVCLPAVPAGDAGSRRWLFWELLRVRLAGVWRVPCSNTTLSGWFQRYRPSPRLLRKFRRRSWPGDAPRFSVILPLEEEAPGWLRDSLHSVTEQTYPHWELLCTAGRPLSHAEHSTCDRHAHVVIAESHLAALQTALSVARGEYVLWLRLGDVLEPHALHRYAEAILEEAPDLLYCDEAIISRRNPDDILDLRLRPAFSYDYYLCHDYLGHLVAIRTSVLRQVGGFRSEVDTVLRVLERANRVTHIPDILYRHRPGWEVDAPSRLQADVQAVSKHLWRMGVAATVLATSDGACRNIVFPLPSRSRVAILIPTRNRVDLLRRCIDSLDATVPDDLADVLVIDHESTEVETLDYLARLQGRYHVLRHEGPFNFSTIMNRAASVAARRFACTHFLLLNNDTEALSPGWLEHMLGHAARPEVGIVGALLLYPDLTVQHAGVVIGMHYGADHRGKFLQAYEANGRRTSGPEQLLLATRDQVAVTGACLLIRTDVFERLGGMDEGFAVGFGDVDLCLRAGALGYKVLLTPQAVLLHHESATRGRGGNCDPHPQDTRLFHERYANQILSWDLYSSPLLARGGENRPDEHARANKHVQVRTVPVVLPAPPTLVTGRAA